jgi:hypothetical protein
MNCRYFYRDGEKINPYCQFEFVNCYCLEHATPPCTCPSDCTCNHCKPSIKHPREKKKSKQQMKKPMISQEKLSEQDTFQILMRNNATTNSYLDEDF